MLTRSSTRMEVIHVIFDGVFVSHAVAYPDGKLTRDEISTVMRSLGQVSS